jgi:5-deoxy-glucuronate isomerase
MEFTAERRSAAQEDWFGPEDLRLRVWTLVPGSGRTLRTPGHETVAVILGGRCRASVGASSWAPLGERADVFSGRATAIYVPPGLELRVDTEVGAEIALVQAPAGPGGEAYVVRPDEVRHEVRGDDGWKREVDTIIDADRPAHQLLVGETFNEPGAWSSYPPHKHDRHAPPHESRLQELYHFRLRPPQGFGIQRIYSPERGIDRAMVVRDGDSVLIPFGYHPVVAAPGYRLYYLWALAGEGRELRLQEDPAHAWIRSRG